MALVDNVTWDITLSVDEIGPNERFPPKRFDTRDQRITDLDSLWRGDFSEWKIQHEVAVNYFHSYSTKLANLLMLSEPELAGGTVESFQAVYDNILDQTRYGGSILRWQPATLSLEAMDIGTWYPLETGGHLFARPYISPRAKSADFDRINFVYTDEEDGGPTVSVHYEWASGTIGKLVANDPDEKPMPDSFYRIVPRLPLNGIWGTAKYVELCGAVLEIIRRYSNNRRVLDLFSTPLPTFRQSSMDADARFGVHPDDTPAERQAKIVKGAYDMLEAGVLSLEDIVADLSFLQPSTAGVNDSLAQVTELKEDLRGLTGLPSLTGPFQAPPSGEALKRIYLPLYAESKTLLDSTKVAVAELTGLPFDWDHIFAMLEMDDEEALQAQMDRLAGSLTQE